MESPTARPPARPRPARATRYGFTPGHAHTARPSPRPPACSPPHVALTYAPPRHSPRTARPRIHTPPLGRAAAPPSSLALTVLSGCLGRTHCLSATSQPYLSAPPLHSHRHLSPTRCCLAPAWAQVPHDSTGPITAQLYLAGASKRRRAATRSRLVSPRPRHGSSRGHEEGANL